MKYRKKPVVIEAIQWDGSWEGCAPIHEFTNRASYETTHIDTGRPQYLCINTLEGDALTVSPKDWIIKGVKGEFYPCKPDIFEMTYEKVDA